MEPSTLIRLLLRASGICLNPSCHRALTTCLGILPLGAGSLFQWLSCKLLHREGSFCSEGLIPWSGGAANPVQRGAAGHQLPASGAGVTKSVPSPQGPGVPEASCAPQEVRSGPFTVAPLQGCSLGLRAPGTVTPTPQPPRVKGPREDFSPHLGQLVGGGGEAALSRTTPLAEALRPSPQGSPSPREVTQCCGVRRPLLTDIPEFRVWFCFLL